MTPARRDVWDAFCANSPDAWFFHSTDFFDYSSLLRPERETKSFSFMMVEGGAVRAVAPFFLERHREYGREWKWATMGGIPIPAPALAPDFTPPQRAVMLDHVFDVIEGLSQELGVDYSYFSIPTLCPAVIEPVRPPQNFLMRHRCLDASLSAQVIDLSLPESRLWGDLHRRHRQSIAKARETLRVRFHAAPELTPEKFDEYRVMHARAAGRVTRPRETFDMMGRWLCSGRGFLAEAVTREGRSAGFEVFVIDRGTVYALSACNEPEYDQLPVRHLVEWESILRLKSLGARFYDIGWQHFGALPYYFPDKKLIDICRFTFRFGGFTAPMFRAERFHSRELWELAQADRNRRFAESYEWKPEIPRAEAAALLREIASPTPDEPAPPPPPPPVPAELLRLAEGVLVDNPKRVRDYLAGSERVLNALVGQLLARGGGGCTPREAQAALIQALSKQEPR